MYFREIGRHVRKTDGSRLSRQAVQKIHDAALTKMRWKLEQDPIIRDWMLAEGIQLPDPAV